VICPPRSLDSETADRLARSGGRVVSPDVPAAHPPRTTLTDPRQPADVHEHLAAAVSGVVPDSDPRDVALAGRAWETA